MQELDLLVLFDFKLLSCKSYSKLQELLRAARKKRAARVVRVLFGFFWQERPGAHNFRAKTAQPLLHGETGPDNAA